MSSPTYSDPTAFGPYMSTPALQPHAPAIASIKFAEIGDLVSGLTQAEFRALKRRKYDRIARGGLSAVPADVLKIVTSTLDHYSFEALMLADRAFYGALGRSAGYLQLTVLKAITRTQTFAHVRRFTIGRDSDAQRMRVTHVTPRQPEQHDVYTIIRHGGIDIGGQSVGGAPRSSGIGCITFNSAASLSPNFSCVVTSGFAKQTIGRNRVFVDNVVQINLPVNRHGATIRIRNYTGTVIVGTWSHHRKGPPRIAALINRVPTPNFRFYIDCELPNCTDYIIVHCANALLYTITIRSRAARCNEYDNTLQIDSATLDFLWKRVTGNERPKFLAIIYGTDRWTEFVTMPSVIRVNSGTFNSGEPDSPRVSYTAGGSICMLCN